MSNFIQQKTEAWKKIEFVRWLISITVLLWIIWFNVIILQIFVFNVILSHEINWGIAVTITFILHVVFLPKMKGLFKKEFRS